MHIRSKVAYIFLLVALLVAAVSITTHAAHPEMRCTHYSDGCIRCDILDRDGNTIGKIAVDCR